MSTPRGRIPAFQNGPFEIELPVCLKFGPHRTLLRWLHPADAGRLIAFFKSHTPETIYDRYGYALAEMTPERAAALVGVDQERDAALGVFEQAGVEWRLIAIGRFCLAQDGESAEVAFVVHEARRRLGIATALLAGLAAIARQRGVRWITAQVQHDNHAMLEVFRRAGARLTTIVDMGAYSVALALQPGETGWPRHAVELAGGR